MRQFALHGGTDRRSKQRSKDRSRKGWVDGMTCNGNHAISVHADHMVPGGTGGVLSVRISGQGPDPTPC